MLIIAGTLEFDPGERDLFLAASTNQVRESRVEAGCLDFVISADPVDGDRVFLFERWESQEHLAPHLARMQAADAGATSTVKPRAVDVQMYEISSATPIEA